MGVIRRSLDLDAQVGAGAMAGQARPATDEPRISTFRRARVALSAAPRHRSGARPRDAADSVPSL